MLEAFHGVGSEFFEIFSKLIKDTRQLSIIHDIDLHHAYTLGLKT
ncbi:hypothetical protein N752_16990 [Desulforamulus aquiferis]|nr:hypothetical protein N752_16990 [Desulforamulus aquiferis]